MMRNLAKLSPSILLFCVVGPSLAQVPAKSTVAVTPAAAEHAATLAESGHCVEALPTLAKAAGHLTDRELQKRVGLDGVRCATTLQQLDPLQDFLRVLSRQFPHDPEVLYILTHAYSDLATRAASELATTAPTSIPALEMDADTSEPQGKWDQAEKDYRENPGEESPLSWNSFSLGAADPVHGQVRRLISPNRPRKSCNRNSPSIRRMPVRNTCWENWRGRPRILPRRSSISPRPPS